MKKFSNFFMMALLAMGMVACSDNEVPENEGNSITNADKVYMQVKIQLPTNQGSRASAGEEVGSGNEAIINDLKVAFTDLKNNVVAISEVTNQNKPTPGEGFTGGNGTYNVSFKLSNMKDLKTDGKTKYNVLVFCNSKNFGLTVSKPGTFKDDIITLDNFKNWPSSTTSSQLMSNAEITPFTLTANLKDHTDPGHPYILNNGNAIKVERSSARFDYKMKNTGNVYTIPDDVLNGAAKNNYFQITLTHMGLTNINKEFYVLRRVSNDGLNAAATIGGVESANYVVSPYASEKQTAFAGNPTDFTGLTNKYYYPLKAFHDDKAGSGSIPFIELPKATTEYDDQWNGGKKHKIMAYATENTLPSISSDPNTAVDEKQITTAVVFKGTISVSSTGETNKDSYKIDGKDLSEAFKAATQLFVFRNQLFVGWENVKEQAIQVNAPGTTPKYPALAAAYNAIKAISSPTGADYISAGFKVFDKKANDTFANVYYYYFNNHETGNLTDNQATKMEYGVVRNNVYKLAVNNIKLYGHPEKSDSDPDGPAGPVEDSEVYMSVTLNVLPWTVRENNIEF